VLVAFSQGRQRGGGTAGHGPATCKGAADYSQGPPAKGLSTAARPPVRGDCPQGQQPPTGTTGCGQAPCKGRPPAGAAVARRHDRLRPGCKGRPPAARSQGVVARSQPYRLRWGSDAEGGKERARASF
ncbi:hypothetical protein GW17_00058585, partial [Ensete ventricosum]